MYVAAFAPDAGESLGALAGTTPAAATSIAPTADGYLLVDQARFPADFAADVPLIEARFMALSQMPINAAAFGEKISTPAWKAKPSYGVVATDDRMINPDLQRSMYVRAKAKVTETRVAMLFSCRSPKRWLT